MSKVKIDLIAGKHSKLSLEVGEAVKAIRLDQGLTQSDLADKIGKTNGFISLIENGHKMPSLETFYDILQVYNKAKAEIEYWVLLR